MQCDVYRSSKRDGMYVYVVAEADLGELPKPVQQELGAPELALTFELSADRKLSMADASEVLANIETNGFHVQMPRDIEHLVERIAAQADIKGRK